MGKRRLLRRLKRNLAQHVPAVSVLTGLPVRPYTMVWTMDTPVAATGGGVIYLNYENWFKDHPDDYGALVHEYTHLIQNVPGGTVPGDIIEGFADAVRYKLGLYDSSWWSPSPTALAIARMSRMDRVTLSRAMAEGRYPP